MSVKDMVVFLHDQEKENDRLLTSITSISEIIFSHQLKTERNPETQNIFILTVATQLHQISSFIKQFSQQIKALCIRSNVNPLFIPQILERADIDISNHLIFYDDLAIPRRILIAWQAEAQEQLIATATVIDEHLLVTDCSLRNWEIPFDSLPALSAIAINKRSDFEIDEDGSYLYWKSADIHLDMEALRAAVHLEWQERLRSERILYQQQFGKAIATLREKHQLKETDIQGLSEREVKQIEQGEHLQLSTLRKLAQAHGMTVNEYLEKVAEQ